MKTLAQALALLTKRRVMTLAGAGDGQVPSLASEVAGEPIRGSWWGHPKGRLIFRLAEALADHPDVLVLKLVQDKVTFVDRALWPALYRVGTDATRLGARLGSVSSRAASLFDRVQKAGTLRIGKADKNAAAELDGLVIVSQEHGEKGAHVTVIRSWDDWATAQVRAAARKLSASQAEAEIAEAVGEAPRSPVQSPKKPSRRSRR